MTFVLLSILTYYDRLSQYNTSDQDLTLERINAFLADYDRADVTAGSNVSNIVVGLPGSCLKRWMDAHWKIQGRIIRDIYYTNLLPFTAVQVTLALALIFACVGLLGRLLGWPSKTAYLYYLVMLCVALNFPMLKGLCKVLKYDCFSILLAIIALLGYLLAKRRRSFWLLAFSLVTAALAYAEKDTCISVPFFIVLSESVLICFQADSLGELGLKLVRLYFVATAVFLLTILTVVPRLWTHCSELLIILKPIKGYGVFLDLWLCATITAIGALLFFARHGVPRWIKEVRGNRIRIGLFLVLAALFLYAILYQKNDIKWIPESGPTIEAAPQHIWVGRTIDRVALTTLDHGPLLTKAKYLLAEARLAVYFLPEIVVISLLSLPLLIGKMKPTIDGGSIALFAGFYLLHVVAYAYLVVAIEAKYLSLAMLALLLLGAAVLAGVTKCLDEKDSLFGSAAALVITASLITPAFQNSPSHFSYMNLFRSRNAEDIASIELDDYSFWTWMGWGETSYNLVEWAGRHFRGKDIKIGWDYKPPLHYPAAATMVDVQEMRQISDAAQMQTFLTELRDRRKLDFVIISKNTANRDIALHNLLLENRDKAVYVDRRGGIEFGWLFRPDDLVKR
jgi:hypothetical protein